MIRHATILVLSLIIGLLLGLAIIIAVPSTVEYSMVNEGPSGYSKLSTLFNARPIDIRDGLKEMDSGEALIIVSRDQPLEEELASEIASYLQEGGVIIATGSPQFLNSLLETLRVNSIVKEVQVYDMVFNNGTRWDVLAETTCGGTLLLYKPHPIEGEVTPLAYTSRYSYVDENGNGYLDLTEKTGESVVAGLYKIGSGRLIVVASTWAFTNKYIDYNNWFIECLSGKRRIYVDQSLVATNPLEHFKLLVRYQPSHETRLLTMIIAVVVGVASYVVAGKI